MGSIPITRSRDTDHAGRHGFSFLLEPGEGELLWQERTGGKFYRSFKLPVPIKADGVDANYKAGVLRIEMPKFDELKSRTIKIKESK